MSDDNAIDLHLSFASPQQAIPVANTLVDEGWGVQMHVVLEARATGNSEQLQAMHNRLKELSPELGLTKNLQDHTDWNDAASA